MLKQKDITILNIDDYIIARKKSGTKSIIWGKHGLTIFNAYLATLVGELHPNKIHGALVFGMRHYIRNYKK